MIHEIVIKPESPYGKYFLSMEAPEDEEPPVVKSNTKVIDVKPNNRRRLDFTDGAIDPDPVEEPVEETPPDAGEQTPEQPVDDSNPMGSTPTDDTAPEVTDPDNPDTETSPDLDVSDTTDFTADDTGATAGDDGTTSPSVNDDGTELTTDDPGNGPDVGDDTDFTADDGTTPATDNGTAEEQPPADGADQKKGPGLEYDSTRKYALFLNYESLINALSNYITKLENNLGDDLNANKIIKTAVLKLREIKDLCYDYITMKYESATYIQSLLFYQNSIIVVQSIFDMLTKMKKYLKTENEE